MGSGNRRKFGTDLFSKNILKRLFNKLKFIIFVRQMAITVMTKKEIKQLIEEEKHQMHLFLKVAKRLQLTDEEIEKQTDFYLDRISEFQKQYDNSPDYGD